MSEHIVYCLKASLEKRFIATPFAKAKMEVEGESVKVNGTLYPLKTKGISQSVKDLLQKNAILKFRV